MTTVVATAYQTPSWSEFGAGADGVTNISFEQKASIGRRLSSTVIGEAFVSAPPFSTITELEPAYRDGQRYYVPKEEIRTKGVKLAYSSPEDLIRTEGTIEHNSKSEVQVSVESMITPKTIAPWKIRMAGSNSSLLLGTIYKVPAFSMSLHHEIPRQWPITNGETVGTASIGQSDPTTKESVAIGVESRMRGLTHSSTDFGVQFGTPDWTVTAKTDSNHEYASASIHKLFGPAFCRYCSKENCYQSSHSSYRNDDLFTNSQLSVQYRQPTSLSLYTPKTLMVGFQKELSKTTHFKFRTHLLEANAALSLNYNGRFASIPIRTSASVSGSTSGNQLGLSVMFGDF